MNGNHSGRFNTYLANSLKQHRKGLAITALYSFSINMLMLAVPLYLLQIFNRVIPSRSIDTFIYLTILTLVAILVMSALEWVRNLTLSRFSGWIDQKIARHILSGSIALSSEINQTQTTSVFRYLSTIRQTFSSQAILPLLDLPWTPVFIAVLFLIHPWIGWVTVLGAIVLIFLGIFNEIATQEKIQNSDEAQEKTINLAASILRNADVIQAMGMRDNLVTLWDQQNNKAVNSHLNYVERSSWIVSIAHFIRTSLQIILLAVATWLILRNEISAGALIASMLIMNRAMSPLDSVISSWKTVVNTRYAFEKVSESLNHAPELEKVKEYAFTPGTLRVQEVSFRHENQAKSILNKVSFTLEPGQIALLKGKSASGKTTLARLLVGLQKPLKGQITLGKHTITVDDNHLLGENIGYLPQDVELFSGTIESNIARMGKVELERVKLAAKLAAIDDMISHLPNGYATEIGEQGANLSGGQRQRLALARAIYHDPRFIILDEPDANLDEEGKKALLNTFEYFRSNGSIVIIISHRSYLEKHVDKIITLKDGRCDCSDSVSHPEVDTPRSFLRHELRLSDISLLTSPTSENAKPRFSLSLTSGRALGIVGNESLAKDYLLDVISGTVNPEHGTAMLNNINLNQLKRSQPQSISRLGHHSFTQACSLLDHICHHIDHRNTEKFKISSIKEFIHHTGITDTIHPFLDILEKNKSDLNLTNQENQLLELFSVLYTQPDLLILEEPFQFLTSKDTAALCSYLDKLKKSGTLIIVISNQNHLVRCVDHVVRLESNNLIAIENQRILSNLLHAQNLYLDNFKLNQERQDNETKKSA